MLQSLEAKQKQVTHIISKFFVVTLKLTKKSSNFLLLRVIQTSGINSDKI